MKEKVQIRKLKKSDASAIAELSSQLGYDVDLSIILKQIGLINATEDHFGFVAIVEEKLAGYIHGFKALRLTTTPFIEIGGLIIRDRYRRKKIGSLLVQYLENNIDPYKMIRVRCNVTRLSAHRFYANLSYVEKKQQKIFEKTIQHKK